MTICLSAVMFAIHFQTQKLTTKHNTPRAHAKITEKNKKGDGLKSKKDKRKAASAMKMARVYK
jgi:cell division protein FtsL